MSSPGPGSGGSLHEAVTSLLEQRLRAERVVKAGASWFIIVAVLSMINSILDMIGVGIRFIFGLGIAHFVDFLAREAGQGGFVLDLIINGFVAGIFVVFWNFARKGQKWAFVVGMALYALDALLMLYFKDILAVAFHAYGLYRIYTGMNGIPVLRDIEANMTTAGAPIQPS